MDNKTFKKLKDNEKQRQIKKTKIEEDNIKIDDPATKNYIKINGKKIEDVIKENVEKMLSITGEIDPANVVQRDIVDLNLLSMYDSNNSVIHYDLKDVKKGSDYWEKETDKYIKTLKAKAKEDISSLSKDELSDLIENHNKEYLKVYIAGIKSNALDLANEITRRGYANRLADTLADLQIQEINKIGVKEFLELDLDKKPYQFTYYIDVKDLKIAQKNTIQTANDIDKYYKDQYPNHKIKWKSTKTERNTNLLFSDIKSIILVEQEKRVQKIYEDNKELYDKRYKKRLQIDKLLNEIALKYKEQNDYLNRPRFRALDNDIVDNTTELLNDIQSKNRKLEKTNYNTTLVGNKIFSNNEYDTNDISNLDKVNAKDEYGLSYYKVNIPTKNQEITTTTITLFNRGATGVYLSKNDKSINDAIGTLIDAGHKGAILKQLYNFINKGELSNDYVPQENLDNLLKEMLNMDVKIEIDYSEQFNLAGYKKALEDYEKKTGKKAQPKLLQSLLNIKVLKDVPLPNGETTTIIQFMDYPAIYDYAKRIKQIASVPAEIKNIGYNPKRSNRAVQITPLTSIMRDVLVQQIELRKSGVNLDIVINHFFSECQFYDVIDKNNINKVINNDKRKDRCKKLEIILDTFIDKNYIKDYKINSRGRVNKYSITIKF